LYAVQGILAVGKFYRPYRYRPPERPSKKEVDKMKADMAELSRQAAQARREAYEEIEREKREQFKKEHGA